MTKVFVVTADYSNGSPDYRRTLIGIFMNELAAYKAAYAYEHNNAAQMYDSYVIDEDQGYRLEPVVVREIELDKVLAQ